MADLVNHPSPMPSRKVLAATVGAVIGAAIAQWSEQLAAMTAWLAFLDSEPAKLAAPVLGAALAGYIFREKESV